MAKVIQLTGQRPAGWAKDRFAWRKAVIGSAGLSSMAKLLANELAFGFSNHETGECSPGIPALMAALTCTKRTVLRALADLVAHGWLVRRGGAGPGKRAVYAFRMRNERVTEMTPERVTEMTPERVTEMTPERVTDFARTGDKNCSPPKPPYMDEPNMNQTKPWPRHATKIVVPGGVRPTPFSQLVEFGSDAEAAWEEWLAGEGFPPLAKIGLAKGVTKILGWDMPHKWPPSAGDETARRIARRFCEWLKARA